MTQVEHEVAAEIHQLIPNSTVDWEPRDWKGPAVFTQARGTSSIDSKPVFVRATLQVRNGMVFVLVGEVHDGPDSWIVAADDLFVSSSNFS